MAIQHTAGRVAGTQRAAERGGWPSTIPANTTIGIYDGVIDAVQAAAALRQYRPDSRVWLAFGISGAENVRQAWESRSWLDRIAGALGDESQLVEALIKAANEGQTVVAATGSAGIEGFCGAAAVYRVGRWTFGRVR